MINNVTIYGPELEYLCKEGYIDKVYDLLKNGSKYTNDLHYNFNVYNWGLEGACESGNIELVELMISKGADLFNYLYAACKGSSKNKRKVIDILIRHGADNFYDGLCGACESGDKTLVEFMISKNIEASLTEGSPTEGSLQDWIYVIYRACKHGHYDIAELLMVHSYVRPIHKTLPKKYFEYKQAQVLTYTKLHLDLINFILKKIGDF